MSRFLILLLFSWLWHLPSLPAQHIFAKKTISAPKNLTVPDLKHTYSLGAKEFAHLSQGRKNNWHLLRSSHFLFERWRTEIQAPANWNRPQLLIKGDSALVLTIESNPARKRLSLQFQIFDLNDGASLYSNTYNLPLRTAEGQNPKIEFSPDRSRFVVYNYIPEDHDENTCALQVFETGRSEALREMKLDWPVFGSSTAASAHISDNGDLFFASADAATYKLRTAYWPGDQSGAPKELESNFFFERPAGALGNLKILRAGATTYYLAFTAHIGRELTGLHVSALNVVLNTALATQNMDMVSNTIDSLYLPATATLLRGNTKETQAPRRLQDYKLQEAWIGPEGTIILAIEQVSADTYFHGGPFTENLGSAVKPAEDKYYRAGDLLLLAFSPGVEMLWQRLIGKEQYSKGNPSGLSYVGGHSADRMRILTSDNARRGRIFALEIGLQDGSVLNTTLLLSGNYELVKDGSAWLDDESLLLCAGKPGNTARRNLFLIELK